MPEPDICNFPNVGLVCPIATFCAPFPKVAKCVIPLEVRVSAPLSPTVNPPLVLTFPVKVQLLELIPVSAFKTPLALIVPVTCSFVVGAVVPIP